MNDLMDLDDLAELYKCGKRHVRDVIVKTPGFPEIAPGSSPRNPRYLRIEVRAFLHRKPVKTARTQPAQGAARV